MVISVELLRLLRDPVLIRRQESAHKSVSAIVIPDTASEKPDQGEFIAVGPGAVMKDGKLRPLDVKAGDKVLFGKYAGRVVKVGGDEPVVMREDGIIAVL